MWAIYRPDGEDSQEWWLRLDDLGDNEAEMIEARSGMDWEEWKLRLLKGNIRARRALLWSLLRRQHMALRYEDVRFTAATFSVEFDAQELGEMIRAMEKDAERRTLKDEEQAGLAAFREALETARPAQGKARAGSDV